MTPVLLDTCIVIDYLRQKDGAIVYVHSLKSTPRLSSMTIMELYAGIKGNKEKRMIESIAAHSIVLDVTHPIAVQSGEYLKQYRPSHGIGAVDSVIAATAQFHEIALATLNVKHFPMFKNLQKPY